MNFRGSQRFEPTSVGLNIPNSFMDFGKDRIVGISWRSFSRLWPRLLFLAAFDRLPPLLYCRRSRNSLWNFCDRLIQDYLSSQTLQIRPQWSVLSVTSAFWSKGPRLFRTASFWRLSITCRNKGWTSDASYFTVTLSACVVKRICCLDQGPYN